MKILIPCSGFGRIYRGIEIWVNYLSKEFVKKGIDVYIVCGSNTARKKIKGIKILKFPIIKREFLMYKQRPFEEISSLIESATLSISSLSYLMNNYFDAIISPQWSDLYSFLILKKLKKTKTIFCFQSKPRKLTKILYFPLLLGAANKIVSISNFVKENVKKVFGLDSTVIYNGVDTKLFHPLTTRKKGKITLLYVGGLLKKKGIYTLIDAVKELDAKKFELLIAGDGPEEKNIKQKVKAEKIVNVKLLGKIIHEKLPRIYGSADIVVVPSEYPEAFGIVAAEAMACGKPIIASNIGGLGEIVRKSKSGLLFKPGNKKELMEKILSLAYNTKIRKRMGNDGRKFAEKELDWSKIAEKYIQLIVD
jgi:glycosyltransferase involved in cell wall biosynthesis